MGLDRAPVLPAHAAIAEGEDGGAGAVEMGVGDIGVEGERHRAAIAAGVPPDQRLRLSPPGRTTGLTANLPLYIGDHAGISRLNHIPAGSVPA